MANILEVKNLKKIFAAGKPAEVRAVNGVDFAVGAGEIVMIMGPSGSGKTTVLTMIGGLLTPTSGSVHWQEQDVYALRSNARTAVRREQVGFIFQSFNLLENLSALENVMVAGFTVTNRRERAEELLRKLGLAHRLHARPKDLSGGERQRVAIARAMINDAALILADEPTANLDRAKGHEVMMLLCSLGCEQKKSVVIVSHDERIKDVAHQVLYIEDGKLVRTEPGNHNQVCTMKHHSF
ncbi:MAG: ABC transporter ATP-binding protein [Patescibacteria group bacterium]|jgi:putative ABC transport system ATP-binding protein